MPYELKVYQRDKQSMLAPPALKAIHPLGKSPVITDGDITVAESGAILEYLAHTYGDRGAPELGNLLSTPGTEEHRQVRYWMHFAEGSLMNWLLMKLVFMSIPKQPMPFFVRPIARQLCGKVQEKIVDPNVHAALDFIENHLAVHTWFAGERLTVADFQMSFAVEAALARGGKNMPRLQAYRDRMNARLAYQRAIQKGGPVVIGG
jgi:glutathione S-transferase